MREEKDEAKAFAHVSCARVYEYICFLENRYFFLMLR
jgi:hypothetical protein